MRSTSSYSHGRSGNTDELRRVFIRRVHQLLKLGYDRMNAAQFRAAEEPDISGELVRAMEQVHDDPKSEAWVSRFSIHDDSPVHDPVRKGTRRHRVDIRLDSLEQRPRQRFFFEAKRLDDKHPVGVYLGRTGLGCFLQGDYARDEEAAGMLGYVQSKTLSYWAEKIAAAIAKRPSSFKVVKQNPWRRHKMAACPNHTYRSRHERAKADCSIEIYHTLLAFC